MREHLIVTKGAAMRLAQHFGLEHRAAQCARLQAPRVDSRSAGRRCTVRRQPPSSGACNQGGTGPALGRPELRSGTEEQEGASSSPAICAPAAAQSWLTPSAWDTLTTVLLHLATLCGVACTVQSGGAAAAAGSAPPLAWVSTLSTLTSFFILSSTFVDDGEAAGILCYMTGFFGTYFVFAQSFLAGSVPPAAFWPATALAAASTAANSAKLAGALDERPWLWQAWRDFAGCVGWALVPQIAWLTLCPPASSSVSWAPALLSGAAGVALLLCAKAGPLPRSCHSVWDVGSWCATLLFMMEPIAQLAAHARDPAGLAALHPAGFLLPALATGLQVPRALRANVHMWFTGTSWATTFAAVQAGAAAAAAGRWPTALGIAAALCAFYWGVLAAHAAAAGLPSWRRSVGGIVRVYRQQMQPFHELRDVLLEKL